MSTVLAVLYLIFNEGYAATQGTDWTQPALCQEAMRLGRILAGLLPAEPEVHGPVALMELHASRLPARTDDAGHPVLLGDQDRRRWDRLLIRHGLAALARAESLGGGPYTIQAAIAACHARSPTAAATDWKRIAALYEVLACLQPSPVVRLNQAVAVGKAGDPERGLTIVEALESEPALRAYPQLPAVRGELLAQLGRLEEARLEFARAAALQRRANSLPGQSGGIGLKPPHQTQPVTAEQHAAWTEEQCAGIEIVDGMVLVGPRAAKRHNRLARLLANALDSAAGPDWNADTDFDVRLQDVPLNNPSPGRDGVSGRHHRRHFHPARARASGGRGGLPRLGNDRPHREGRSVCEGRRVPFSVEVDLGQI